MTFRELLNEYLSGLQCSAKQLAARADVSEALISRYRSGARSPAAGTVYIRKIADAIASLSAERSEHPLQADAVYQKLNETVTDPEDSFPHALQRMNFALLLLHINQSRLARAMNYDASYISRVRSGQRRPFDRAEFISRFCTYISHLCAADPVKRQICLDLIGAGGKDPDAGTLEVLLTDWVHSGPDTPDTTLSSFLREFDSFDLNNYIRPLHFEHSVSVPDDRPSLPAEKTYLSAEDFRQAHLDFFSHTLYSESTDPVYLYSDMAIKGFSEDLSFIRQYVYSVGATLRRGLKIHVIHNLHRPFREIMLSLAAWIPLYMTGHVVPYYLSSPPGGLFTHVQHVSGSVALTGEGILGAQTSGKLHLTTRQEALAYHKKRVAAIFEKATPLFEIFREDNAETYTQICFRSANTHGRRFYYLASLGLYSISEELLERICRRNHIPQEDTRRIAAYASEQRTFYESVLSHDSIEEEIPDFDEEEFNAYPMSMALSSIFYDKDILYTYVEYREHLEQTLAFAKTHPNYHPHLSSEHPFRNIQIRLHEGVMGTLSKNTSPSIHFVFRHPLLLKAMQQMHLAWPITGYLKPGAESR